MTERETESPGERRLRVLIVDDETAIVGALDLVMRRAKIDAVITMSGDDAFRLVMEQEFDVLLLDLRLSDMSGLTLFNLVVSHKPQLGNRTIFMTGDITIEAEVAIASAGCILIRKPFDIHDVTATVRRIATSASIISL
ncbi:MAG: response regulator [Gemmatimonadaceae bacterium]